MLRGMLLLLLKVTSLKRIVHPGNVYGPVGICGDLPQVAGTARSWAVIIFNLLILVDFIDASERPGRPWPDTCIGVDC